MSEHDSDARKVTLILQNADQAVDVSDELLSLVYDQLRRLAAKQMSHEIPGQTLQPTALVHEGFLKLIGDRDVPWQNRRHFYVAAAEAMRQILLDHARSRGRLKRGGNRRRVPLSMADVAESWNLEETVSLDDALRRLESRGAEIAEVVRLRFFAGLTIEQTAEALDISPATVKRRWEFGRTWLYRELGKEAGA